MEMFKKVLIVLLIWRIFLFGIQYFSTNIPYRDSFPYVDAVLNKYEPPFLRPWGNFDGVHYLTIAKSSYSAQYTQAFFPLYPLTIRWLGGSLFLKNYLISAQAISSFFWILAIIMLVKLIELDYKAKIAWQTVTLLLLFPTSFYFISVYAESMFLFFVLTSFYFARKGNWWCSGIFGALASATKLFGVFLFPALLVEHSLQEKIDKIRIEDKLFGVWNSFKKHLNCYLPISISTLGLILYMVYLKNEFNNPFYFATAQSAFGASRSVTKLVLLYQVFWRYFKMIVTVTKTSPLYFTVWLEFLSVVFFLFLLWQAYKQKIRLSYIIFAIFSLITPTLTGTFSSMPRYVLILFPGFIAFGLIKNRKLVRFVYGLEIVLLVVCTIFFLRGYWVA